MIDPVVVPSVIKMLQKGITPAAVSNMLDLEVEDVLNLHVQRQTTAADVEELSAGMSRYAHRAFEEGMRMLDEATPAIKVRLIGGAMGQALRLIATSSPKEYEDLQQEVMDMFASTGSDGNDVDSIYNQYNHDDPTAYNPEVDRPA